MEEAKKHEVNQALLRIISEGLLRIRTLGFQGDATGCAHEADHIHNLPGLVAEPDPARLSYYLEVEKLSFLDTRPHEVEVFHPHWACLEAAVESLEELS